MLSPLRLCATLGAILVLAGACNSSKSAVEPSTPTTSNTVRSAAASKSSCNPPQVQYTPYPGHGDGLSQIPWIRGEPRASELVALLWYWPQEWQRRHLREARIFTGGVAPQVTTSRSCGSSCPARPPGALGASLLSRGVVSTAPADSRTRLRRSATPGRGKPRPTPRSSSFPSRDAGA